MVLPASLHTSTNSSDQEVTNESIPIPRPLCNVYFGGPLRFLKKCLCLNYWLQIPLRHKGIGSLPSPSATITTCWALTPASRGRELAFGTALYNPASARMVSSTSSFLFIWGSLLCAYSARAKYMPKRRQRAEGKPVNNGLFGGTRIVAHLRDNGSGDHANTRIIIFRPAG
jgi:hypothetical protein